MTEPQLPFGRAPRIEADDIADLVRALTGHDWRSARELAGEGWNDRRLRATASASEGRIVSGQKGYALIEAVTVEEAQHAADWLDRQARSMSKRASEIRRAMHRRFAA